MVSRGFSHDFPMLSDGSLWLPHGFLWTSMLCGPQGSYRFPMESYGIPVVFSECRNVFYMGSLWGLMVCPGSLLICYDFLWIPKGFL